ncbi:hypothetical protein B0H13DRAFT_2302439 [Mycena leptocephala]|nr:hypothetical protein B0H13DRAFT_2302439 [Mycena leptocephala]
MPSIKYMRKKVQTQPRQKSRLALTLHIHVPPPCLTDDPLERKMRRYITTFNSDANTFRFDSFLGRAQSLANHFHPGVFRFFDRLITFNTPGQKRNTTTCTAYTDAYDRQSTFVQFARMNRTANERVSVGLAATWTRSWVGVGLNEWNSDDDYLWAVLTIHPPDGQKGKTIAVFDCNAKSFNPRKDRESTVLNGRQRAVVKTIRDVHVGQQSHLGVP